jgi:hypothetical protein
MIDYACSRQESGRIACSREDPLGKTTMKPVRLILLAAALGFASQAALAFQETTTGKGQGPAGATPAAPLKPGPEVRLPGLGSIGTLPRLDFGLELLYGAGEPKGVREELNKNDPNDLQIRGTVKYRFPN